MVKTTVCIITKNRTERVQSVLQNLSSGIKKPDEVLIVHMNEAVANYATMPFLIRKIRYDDAHNLPLAGARNYAAKVASHSALVFLDADCIPAENLLENYVSGLKDDAMLTGNVRYLDADFTSEKNLFKNSIPHPNRQLKPGAVPYELFWSLNFACTKNTFAKVGGFDANFTGYGAEDTDFGFSARKMNISLLYANADVYHQYHPTYRPPLNHLNDIVKNAIRFYKKWEVWPMKDWLQDFEERRYIHMKNNKICLLKEPSKAEIDAVYNTNPWGF